MTLKHFSLPPLLTALGVVLLAGNATAAGPFSADTPKEHALGWLCVDVSNPDIARVSAFNTDAPEFTMFAGKSRYHVTPDPSGGARVCVPIVTTLGDGEVPEETLVFEREIATETGVRAAQAELVLTPTSPQLHEVTMKVIGSTPYWTEQNGVWTFQATESVTFPERIVRGLDGLGDGPPPPSVFPSAPLTERFSEPCVPVRLPWPAPANFGLYNPTTRKVSPRGVEPLRLAKGDVLSLCEGLSTDGELLAVAKPIAPGEVGWFLIPRETELTRIDTQLAYHRTRPLGGYHVCRVPTWTTHLLKPVPLAQSWELLANGQWAAPALPTDGMAAAEAPPEASPRDLDGVGGLDPVPTGPSLRAGLPVTMLDHRNSWALIRAVLDGATRTFAIPGQVVALPSGPSSEPVSLMGGLCPWPAGRWRTISANTQAFHLAQDAPGSELAGLWLELPLGTRVLAMCDDKRDCDPIYVGGAQSDATDRVVLVRYAGHLLGIRESTLRDRVTGTFETRVERRDYWRAQEDLIRPDVIANWAIGLGPGARLSFVDDDAHAWTLKLRLQELVKGWGFEAGFAAGGNGLGTFLEFSAGAGILLAELEGNIELRAGFLGKLDLFVTGDGGLGVDLIAKAQLRWNNDVAPVSFELGFNVGFGGTFGSTGDSAVSLGMPLWLLVDVFEF